MAPPALACTTLLTPVGIWRKWRFDRNGSSESRKFLAQQFRKLTYDAIRLHRAAFRQSLTVWVVPDRMDAELLRRRHFPLQIVADHPGLMRFDSQRGHGVQIGARLGLAKTMF